MDNFSVGKCPPENFPVDFISHGNSTISIKHISDGNFRTYLTKLRRNLVFRWKIKFRRKSYFSREKKPVGICSWVNEETMFQNSCSLARPSPPPTRSPPLRSSSPFYFGPHIDLISRMNRQVAFVSKSRWFSWIHLLVLIARFSLLSCN